MGLIRAFAGAASSTLADQWKEYIYCDSLPNDVVVRRGQKRTNGANKGSDNVITNGSLIVVNDGQAAIIVSDGAVREFVAEPGGFKFASQDSPTIFEGGFGKGIVSSFKEFSRRFAQGGDVGKDQRVYYFNTKELVGCKFGTSESIVYDDPKYKSINVRFFGTAALRVTNPMCFYKNVCGNIQADFTLPKYWENQLRGEFVTYLGQAVAMLSVDGYKYSQIPQNQMQLVKYMNNVMSNEWVERRGISVVSTAIPSVSLDPKDQARINKFDEMEMMSDPTLAAGRMVSAQANAMESAAENKNGAIGAFMGMGMAQNAGGVNASQLFSLGQQQKETKSTRGLNGNTAQSAKDSWKCPKCGETAQGKFCPECGSAKPVEPEGWQCPNCGIGVKGKFCSECGAQKPAGAKICPDCGIPVTGKFCGECGKSM